MGRAQTTLRNAQGNTINNSNNLRREGDVTVHISPGWRIDVIMTWLQIANGIISCIMFVMIIALHQQLEAHNRSVESINRHTSLTAEAKSADEKAFFSMALLGTGHGQRVVDEKLATDSYLGAALYPPAPAGVYSRRADSDLHRNENSQPDN